MPWARSSSSVIDLSADLAKLIEQEESAMKALDDARKRADELVREANSKAKMILEAAKNESAFQAFVEERLSEIEKRRKIEVIDRAEASCFALAELAERNLDRAINVALKRVLGPEA